MRHAATSLAFAGLQPLELWRGLGRARGAAAVRSAGRIPDLVPVDGVVLGVGGRLQPAAVLPGSGR